MGDWGVWEPPAWPPELARFAEAASNLSERRAWDAFRRAYPLRWSDEAIAARVGTTGSTASLDTDVLARSDRV